MLFFKRQKDKKENIFIENVDEEQLYAPISGKLIPLEQVNDAVFSQKIMGDGIAIEPEEGALYAPMKGTISVVFPTKHMIGIEAENGANIIIHIGIDTVELKGQGFETCVKPGNMVEPGELLLKLDLPMIRKNHSATTMVIIENWNEFQIVPTEQARVEAGEKLLKLVRA